MSSVRALFERLCNGSEQILGEIANSGWQEDLLLDFKTLEKHSAPMTTNDRKNLAEALSGFANSEGGVIVWGIDARMNNPEEADVAQALKPIDKLNQFVSDLQRHSPQLVAPGIVGIEHFRIPETGSTDRGYVVTYVPKSETNLHMARAKDQHRFYYRSGASFLPMEAFMVADRYGRRPQPKLELHYRVEEAKLEGRKLHTKVVLGIRNAGQGIALYPALAVYESAMAKLDRYGLDGNGRTGLPERLRTSRRPDDARRVFAGGANDVVHPDTELDVTIMHFDTLYMHGAIEDLRVTHELYCQGFAESGETVIPATRVLADSHGI